MPPNSDGSGLTFTNRNVDVAYPGFYLSIRKVDFRNLKSRIVDESFPLKNGHYEHRDRGGYAAVDLDSIHYLGTSPQSKGGAALVLYSWFAAGGSSSQGGTADVLTVRNGRLRCAQEIGWDTHFQAGGPTDSFDPSKNTLVIRAAHYIPGDAHCCVSAMDVVTYQWDGARFVQSGIRTELSEYGKSEGKILPH